MEKLNSIQYLHDISYPGKCKKSGVIVDNKEYMIKFSSSETERISLYYEMYGLSVCNQLYMNTSKIRLISYENQLCLLSEKWNIGDREQYFPLASFYEELLDVREQVAFTYSLFMDIVKSKMPNNYDNILNTFWGMFIVDYLTCNSRSAGNIGFLHGDYMRLAPIFDCSTSLETINDERYKNLSFPKLQLQFDEEEQGFYDVLCSNLYCHKDVMLAKAKQLIDINLLGCTPNDSEGQYMLNVISYRYNELQKI